VGNLNPVDYAVFYALAVATTLLSILFLSASWHSLLNSLSIRARMSNLFLYTWVGYF
jgi:hypothetical protein